MSHSILINDNLYNELKDYCDLNGIKVSNLCGDLLKKGLNELKYGDIPFGIVIKPTVIPTEQELVPVQPMSKPSLVSLTEQMSNSDDYKKESRQEMRQEMRQDVAKMEQMSKSDNEKEESGQESGQIVHIEEKNEEIKTKPKRTRVLN